MCRTRTPAPVRQQSPALSSEGIRSDLGQSGVARSVALSHRLTHVAEGHIREDPGDILLSSIDTPWAGFSLERHAVSSGQEKRLYWPTPRLGLVGAGSVCMEERDIRQGEHQFIAGKNCVTIWPGGYESASLTWSGRAEIIDVEIFSNGFRGSAEFDFRCVELEVQRGIQDPHLAALVLAMKAEVGSGCPSGRIYGESVSIALAAHIVARYSVVGKSPGASRGRLSWSVLSRILDFIQANLGRDLGVEEIAALANTSPSHFIQKFHSSKGITPHQYVKQQRIVEARRLLTEDGLSIAEIAIAVGFANQSHFTESFRQIVGTTPKLYREQHQGVRIRSAGAIR
jgi:AraC family transcriptional regulator